MKTLRRSALVFFCLFYLGGGALGLRSGAASESGTLAVYFMGEKVGYEDYSWTESDTGYVLKVTGGMTKPLRLEIESMTLSLSRDFIPVEYHFAGSLNGVSQDVSSRFEEGHARNIIRAAGQENILEAEVRRDTLVLPNPIFSPYIVLAKKYGCGLKDPIEVSAYMIPQVEMTGTLAAAPNDSCLLTLNLAGVEAILTTDEERRFVSLSIPGQNIKVLAGRAD